LEWGPKENILWDSYAISKVEPAALATKPDFYDWMKPYFKCFSTLSGRRSNGMTINPIAFSEIVKYVEIYEPDEPERFIEFVSLIDNIFVEVKSKQKPSNDKKVKGAKK
jgi:hypothetical protein